MKGFKQENKVEKMESVKVILRCRPLSHKEETEGLSNVIRCDTNRSTTTLKGNKQMSHNNTNSDRIYNFDKVFDERVSQAQVFEESVKDLINSAIEGYNATILAYGQTGSGKTHTMIGNLEDSNQYGIIPRTFDYIFEKISSCPKASYLVRVYFIEIYNEEVKDLLNYCLNKKLTVKENFKTMNWEIKEVSHRLISNKKEGLDIIKEGIDNRTTANTVMNSHSSRSHAILSITIESFQLVENDDASTTKTIKMGKINLVDLAGSERNSGDNSDHQRFVESKNINLSLSTLGKVVNCLLNSSCTYIPYRDSNLTKLLQDSLGGNTRTVVFSNISPAQIHYWETFSTLNYVTRIKLIKNTPIVNENVQGAILCQYEREILMQDDIQSQKSSQEKFVCEKDYKEKMHIIEEENKEILKSIEDMNKRLIEKNKEQELIILNLDQLQKKILNGKEMVRGIKKSDNTIATIPSTSHDNDNLEKLEVSWKKEMELLMKKNEGLKNKIAEQEIEITSLNMKLAKFWFKGIISRSFDNEALFNKTENNMEEHSLDLLKKEVKLKEILINNFIPEEELKLLMNLVKWIPEDNKWIIEYPKITNNQLQENKPIFDDIDQYIRSSITDLGN